jgi:hypothetical protein
MKHESTEEADGEEAEISAGTPPSLPPIRSIGFPAIRNLASLAPPLRLTGQVTGSRVGKYAQLWIHPSRPARVEPLLKRQVFAGHAMLSACSRPRPPCAQTAAR